MLNPNKACTILLRQVISEFQSQVGCDRRHKGHAALTIAHILLCGSFIKVDECVSTIQEQR